MTDRGPLEDEIDQAQAPKPAASNYYLIPVDHDPFAKPEMIELPWFEIWGTR
jgi:hypothetical protein